MVTCELITMRIMKIFKIHLATLAKAQCIMRYIVNYIVQSMNYSDYGILTGRTRSFRNYNKSTLILSVLRSCNAMYSIFLESQYDWIVGTVGINKCIFEIYHTTNEVQHQTYVLILVKTNSGYSNEVLAKLQIVT